MIGPVRIREGPGGETLPAYSTVLGGFGPLGRRPVLLMMAHAMPDTAAILTHGMFRTPFAKTAHGLVRGPSRYRIVGLVDEEGAGCDAGMLLDGCPRGIPTFATLGELLAAVHPPPRWCVAGIATPGGVMPEALRQVLREALAQGIGVVNGLHEILAEDPLFQEARAQSGAQIIDIRRPKKRSELHFWTGAIAKVHASRIAVLGTDCALGKRTTCHVLAEACRKAGLRTEIVHTGQTGWLQGLRYGFILDATPNDFVGGELEHAIVTCDRERAPDLILLEGQSALRNPSGPCGSELILSGGANAVVLQHAPARRFFEDLEELGCEIPSLESEIELMRLYGARVLGITLNHDGIPAGEREWVRSRIAGKTGLSTHYPLLEGLDRLVPKIREHLSRSR